ncbi:MAG TPA: SUF system NifU family Fe-S cluster assembly protein [Gemmataceae bacterium]|jgi:nitrogen fixation NifU-like protein|nr:SUF system NifU family Fe-S cluster assembly protein [Gemmataceae bacterium]
MSDLRELYQDVILDHHKKPRNFRKQENARHIEGFNPLCGDKVTVYVKLDGDVIRDVSFQGSGCAISTASASMMTESLKGKTRAEAEELFKNFHAVLTGQNQEAMDEDKMGKLVVFSGVREFPVRVKCATLPWHTFHAALEGEESKTVSTE